MKNSMLTKQIDIISNQNTKISVPVHEGLIKANTGKEKLVKNVGWSENVPNPYSLDKFNCHAKKINFLRDYKTGYAPI